MLAAAAIGQEILISSITSVGNDGQEPESVTPVMRQPVPRDTKKYNFIRNDLGFLEAHVFDSNTIIPRSRLSALVVHWTAGIYDNGVYGLLDVLQNNATCGSDGCSVQLFADRDGEIFQLTKPLNTQTNHAYGANSRSVGLEIEGRGEDDLLSNDRQYKGVLKALLIVRDYWDIPERDNVAKKQGTLAHYELDPEKQDPGEAYMQQLREDMAA